MSYKLHYAMLLPVDGVIDSDGIGLSEATVARALRKLADQVEDGCAPLKNLIGSPVNSEREDRWVLRALCETGVIRKSCGGWVHVTPETLDVRDTVASREVLEHAIIWDEHSIWMRPENIGQAPVIAGIWNEDGDRVDQLDLADWLAWAGEDDVAAGIRDGWCFTFALQSAASTEPDERNGRIDPLWDDPNFRHAEVVGAELTLAITSENVPRARAYIEQLYPGLIQSVEDDLDRRQQEMEM